ncbi:sugar phosphate isomerase/epimerase family protein [Pseudochelatococcus sp. B33]
MIDAHPLTLIEAAAAGGFTHCGIRLVAPNPGDPLIDVLSEPGAIDALRRRLSDSGVRLLDIEAIWLNEDIDVTTIVPALEAGARLGARYALVVGNDPDPSRLSSNFAALAALAKPLGLRIMLESITYCTINSLQAADALIRDSAAPNAGLLIDTLQFFRSGAGVEQITLYDPSLFSYLQICDAPQAAPATLADRRREARENRLLPGDGELPLRELLDALPAGIPISLEAPTAALRGYDHQTQGIIAGRLLRAFLSGEHGRN